jgi:tripartite-type tricarboxylate transporter receptor subunit TctC
LFLVTNRVGFLESAPPGKTSSEIVDTLNKEINAGLADPKLKALGGMVLSGSPADFRTLIAEEIKKWAKVIRAANIKAE